MNRTINRQKREATETNFWNPEGMGVCDGCAFWVNHKNLRKHMVYRGGTTPVWDGLLVCATCDDVPNPAPQFSRLTLPPDPVPIINPRPEQPTNSGFGYLVTENGDYLNTLSDGDTWGGEFIISEPTPEYP